MPMSPKQWMLLILLALLWGCAFFFVGVALKELPPLTIVLTRVGLAALTLAPFLLAPLAMLVDQPWLLPAPSAGTVGSLVALAVVSAALAYIVFFRIMAVSGPSNAMLVTLLIPLGAIGLGVLVLGERLERHHILGALIIASALVVIDGRLLPARFRGSPR